MLHFVDTHKALDDVIASYGAVSSVDVAVAALVFGGRSGCDSKVECGEEATFSVGVVDHPVSNNILIRIHDDFLPEVIKLNTSRSNSYPPEGYGTKLK